MELKLVNRLVVLGVALVGINGTLVNPAQDPLKIQEQVAMDLKDVMDLEKEVEERKKRNETELYFKGYKIVLKK